MIADFFKLTDTRTLVFRLSRVAALAGVALALAVPGRAQDAEIAHAAATPRGNAVTHWNTIAIDAFKPTQGTNPMGQSRSFAILHASIHDALNAIDRRFEAYTPGLADAHGASVDAAVATAAHDVLVAQVPEQSAMVEDAYSRALAGIKDGAAKASGISVGQASAAANMLRRRGDGSEQAAEPVFVPRSAPGEYQFTPPFDF